MRDKTKAELRGQTIQHCKAYIVAGIPILRAGIPEAYQEYPGQDQPLPSMPADNPRMKPLVQALIMPFTQIPLLPQPRFQSPLPLPLPLPQLLRPQWSSKSSQDRPLSGPLQEQQYLKHEQHHPVQDQKH